MLPTCTINDGRSFFEVPRNPEHTIVFGFSSTGKLAGVSIKLRPTRPAVIC